MPERAWRRPARWLGRIATAAALLAGIAWLSNVPAGSAPPQGLLRLAWRAAGQQVPLCRPRSAEELSRLAPHMRQALDCRVRTLPYHLRVRVDGGERIARAVVSAGASSDRPLYVQEELALAPGPHRLELAFTVAPELARAPGGIVTEGAAQEQALSQALAGAPAYRAELTVTGRPGRIVLVELDPERRGFRVTGG
jgi:hypothetical protein